MSPEPLDPSTRIPAAAVVAVGTGAICVLALGLPLWEVLVVGGGFCATVAGVHLLERYEHRFHRGPLAWLADRASDLVEKRGTGFYGLAGLTAFLRLEAGDLREAPGELAAAVGSPLSAALGWFISHTIEAVMNAVWAALWPLQFMQAFWGRMWAGALVLGAGWTVWWLLYESANTEDGPDPAEATGG